MRIFLEKLKNRHSVGGSDVVRKGALNPNFLNLIINREKFWL